MKALFRKIAQALASVDSKAAAPSISCHFRCFSLTRPFVCLFFNIVCVAEPEHVLTTVQLSDPAG